MICALRQWGRCLATLTFVGVFSKGAGAGPTSFVNFESGHVRPVAAVGQLVFAVDTPDNRLVIFSREDPHLLHPLYSRPPSGLRIAAEVSVGLDPVAVAAQNVICFASGICPFDVWVV